MGTSSIVASLWVRQVDCDLQLLVIWVTVRSMSYEFGMREPLLCRTRVVECGRVYDHVLSMSHDFGMCDPRLCIIRTCQK